MNEPEDIHREQLFVVAERIVAEVIQSLPDDLRAEAEKVPCLLEEFSPDGEVLGRYLGAMLENQISDSPGPIVIYVGTIKEFCEDDEEFEEEIRVTYLHELGHHLGLDESDLEDRGLL